MDYFDILLAKKLNGGGGGDIDLQTLNVTENGTVNAPSGVAYNKVITNVPAPSNALFKQTLSGLPSPIATFTGADAPLDSLKASIEGVQDLHGYDKPWPAGGGKNKAITKSSSFTTKNVTFTINSDGSIKLSGTADTTGNVKVTDPITAKAGTTYTVSIGVSASVIGYGISGFGIGTYTITPTNDYSDACVQVRIESGTTYNTTIYPQLELGSTATSFEPYSNICPISGWSSCDVTVTDDLIDPTYTHTYTIQFKDSSDNPLIVYYGHIDISNGKLIVTHIGEFYDGSSDESWEKRGNPNQYFRITIADAGTYVDASIKSNQFKYANVTNNNTNIGITVATVGNNQVIGARPSNYLDLSLDDWKTMLATNPLQVIYELVTPLEYDLTPIALRSNGVTNISVDCGEVTECKYYSETP